MKHAHAPDGHCHYLLTRDGRPLSDSAGGFERFTESFLAIAAAELFRATGKESYAAEARRAYAAYRAVTDADENVTDYVIENPFAARAVITYCRLHFGSPEDFDRLKVAYDELKGQMRESSAFGMVEVTPHV